MIFLTAVTKIPDRNNVREGGFVWGPGFQGVAVQLSGSVHLDEISQQQACVAVAVLMTEKTQKGENVGPLLAFFFFLPLFH